MQLDGKRFKAAAGALYLSLSDVQKQSSLNAAQVAYYWEYPVTITARKDVEALATLLQVDIDDLIVQGKPKEAILRPDKFVSEKGDIIIKKKKKGK
jgi:hypothetical protein